MRKKSEILGWIGEGIGRGLREEERRMKTGDLMRERKRVMSVEIVRKPLILAELEKDHNTLIIKVFPIHDQLTLHFAK